MYLKAATTMRTALPFLYVADNYSAASGTDIVA